jgi:hypothetical protein
MRLSSYFAAGLLLCPLASAAPQFAYEITRFVHRASQQAILQDFQAAMQDVRALPPEKDNPFNTSVERSVQIHLTTAEDPFAESEAASNPDSDAFTVTVAGKASLVTIIVVLVDRIFWHPETGQLLPDRYVRLLNAFGHEVYGNLPQHLPLQFGHRPVITAPRRV